MTNNLNQYKVVITGLVRNVEKGLEQDIQRLQQATQAFGHVYWLLIESDSTDNTVATLKQLQQQVSNFNFISLGQLDKTIPERTERIGHCRNTYLKELESNPLYQDIDYVIMADLDGANNVLTQNGIGSCFTRTDWDACFANTQGPYYDIWALRHPTWCPTDCWQEYEFLTQHGWKRYPAMFAAIYSKMITIQAHEKWIEVDSAFGGLGIYKKQALIGHRYECYEKETGKALCEHVLFHQQLKQKGARLFINPALINCKNPPHTRKLRFPHNIKLRLRLLFN